MKIRLPPWFNECIEERLEDIMKKIENDPEIRKLRESEQEAFELMMPNVNKAELDGFMEWEDKHLYRRANENERIYSQGMKDGVQLVIALLDGVEYYPPKK